MINYIIRGYLVEQLTGTGYLCFLYWSDIKGIHRSLGFSYEEDMLDSAVMECNSPVRGVIPDRSWN